MEIFFFCIGLSVLFAFYWYNHTNFLFLSWSVICFIHILIMLLIQGPQASDCCLLEEQFSTQQISVSIPQRQWRKVAEVLKSISYQHFHDDVPLLALKIQEYVCGTFRSAYSLTGYREIMRTIKQYEERLKLYDQYSFSIEQLLNGTRQDLISQFPQKQSSPQPHFPKNSDMQVSVMESLQMPFLMLDSKQSVLEPQAKSEATLNSTTLSECRQNLGGLAKLNNFFQSSSAVYSRLDWQTDRSTKKEDSKQLDSFKKKGQGVLEVNSSLHTLLTSEFIYDIKREETQSRHLIREQQEAEKNYKQKMKEMKIFSKITLRKRK